MKVPQLGRVARRQIHLPELAAPSAEHLSEMNELVITTVTPLNVTC